jgi:hypothetical protein
MNGHMDVLKIYGITQITSAKKGWINNPDVYVIIAESLDGDIILGGIRVHVKRDLPLPIEDAVGFYDKKIFSMVQQRALTGTGELCGLWNSRDVAGMGISTLLMRAGISMTKALGLSSLFALCAPVTVSMVAKVGFQVEESLGNAGLFYYPSEDLIATATIIPDTNDILSADFYDRQCIINLRNFPVQNNTEIGPKGKMEVSYNLFISSKSE